MALERNVRTTAYVASSAVTGKRVVTAGTNEQEVKQASVAGTAVPYGVSRVDAAAGDAVDVHVGGTVKAEAGAAVSRDAALTYDNQGRVITATSATYVIGFAETAATGAGQIVEVRLGTPYLKP